MKTHRGIAVAVSAVVLAIGGAAGQEPAVVPGVFPLGDSRHPPHCPSAEPASDGSSTSVDDPSDGPSQAPSDAVVVWDGQPPGVADARAGSLSNADGRLQAAQIDGAPASREKMRRALYAERSSHEKRSHRSTRDIPRGSRDDTAVTVTFSTTIGVDAAERFAEDWEIVVSHLWYGFAGESNYFTGMVSNTVEDPEDFYEEQLEALENRSSEMQSRDEAGAEAFRTDVAARRRAFGSQGVPISAITGLAPAERMKALAEARSDVTVEVTRPDCPAPRPLIAEAAIDVWVSSYGVEVERPHRPPSADDFPPPRRNMRPLATTQTQMREGAE